MWARCCFAATPLGPRRNRISLGLTSSARGVGPGNRSVMIPHWEPALGCGPDQYVSSLRTCSAIGSRRTMRLIITFMQCSPGALTQKAYVPPGAFYWTGDGARRRSPFGWGRHGSGSAFAVGVTGEMRDGTAGSLRRANAVHSGAWWPGHRRCKGPPAPASYGLKQPCGGERAELVPFSDHNQRVGASAGASSASQ